MLIAGCEGYLLQSPSVCGDVKEAFSLECERFEGPMKMYVGTPGHFLFLSKVD